MTKAEAIKQVYEQFADYAARGFTVKQAYEKIFGEETWELFVDDLYNELRKQGTK